MLKMIVIIITFFLVVLFAVGAVWLNLFEKNPRYKEKPEL